MATPKINISKISDFPKVTPTGSDRILIDREGKGGSITLSQIPVSDPVEKRISDEVEDLSNRIDNIATLPEGSTTGDAELREIRVGADGTVYPSAAKAVQTQVSNLQGGIDELKGDLDIERNERIEGDTAISTRLQKNRYEIDNLKAKAEGKLYRTETVESEAYALDVPSSVAPYAEVQKIGGKSVVWNQLIQIKKSDYSYEGITYTKQADGTFLANGTSTKNDGDYINKGGVEGFKVVSKHKYYIWGSDYGGTTTNCMVFQIKRTNGTYYTLKQASNLGIRYTATDVDVDGDCSVFYFVSNGTTLTNIKVSVNVADLTQMFGSGNEPTLKECRKIFSADYYPYDTGTIKSSHVKIVRSLNAEGIEIGSIDVSSFTSDLKSAGLAHDEWSNGKIIRRIGSRSYTSGDESESDYITDGTTTYYPLDTPSEETVPEIDNYINVDGSGTLTFESDDTVHMPVPSTDRFVVDLT